MHRHAWHMYTVPAYACLQASPMNKAKPSGRYSSGSSSIAPIHAVSIMQQISSMNKPRGRYSGQWELLQSIFIRWLLILVKSQIKIAFKITCEYLGTLWITLQLRSKMRNSRKVYNYTCDTDIYLPCMYTKCTGGRPTINKAKHMLFRKWRPSGKITFRTLSTSEKL